MIFFTHIIQLLLNTVIFLFQFLIFTLPIFHLFCKFFNLRSHCRNLIFYLKKQRLDFFVPVGCCPFQRSCFR